MGCGGAPSRAAAVPLLLLLVACASRHASALAPPHVRFPGQSAGAGAGAAGAAAALAARTPHVTPHVKNHRLDPALIPILEHRIAVASGSAAPASALPGFTNLLPFQGSPKVLCILVDFPDAPWDAAPGNPGNTPDFIAQRMFGAGNPDMAPFESLNAFYKRSSYGKLDIQGTVMPYYRAKHNRTYYESLALVDGEDSDPTPGNQALIEEALSDLASKGVDLTQFDNDGDGVMETLYIKWTGLSGEWATFWWAYRSYLDNPMDIGGVRVKTFVWAWVSGTQDCYDWGMPQDEKDACSNTSLPLYRPRTDIHETGHALGLPDLYDYDASVGPAGGVGGFDLMDSACVDLNGFFKWLLGWLTPTVVASGTAPMSLRPMAESGDAALVFPGASKASPFSEFFFVERRRSGAANDDDAWMRGNDGLAVWHVDARVNENGTEYRYDNSYTSHKLMRLMEADGLERIETVDGFETRGTGVLYTSGRSLAPTSKPSSKRYDGTASGAHVTGIGAANGTATPAALSVGLPSGTGASDAVLLPSQQRASYHAAIHAEDGSFVASGALVRGDVILTSGASDACYNMNCTITLGPSLSANGSDAETLKVSAVVEHPTAALQMLFLKSCAARAKPVALAKSDASLRSAAKTRPSMLTGWQTLSGPTVESLAYSYVQYSADGCTGVDKGSSDFFCGPAAAEGGGPCAGDVGSPLVFNTAAAGKDPATVTSKGALGKDTLAGISRGSEVCGASGQPAGLLSVASFSGWITNNLASRRAPCWSKATLLTVAVKPAKGQPANQVFAVAPGPTLVPGACFAVEEAQALAQCTARCRQAELFGGNCKGFSIYSGVPEVNGTTASPAGVMDPPAARYCVTFDYVPPLCGGDTSGYCGKAVAAYRMVWTGK